MCVSKLGLQPLIVNFQGQLCSRLEAAQLADGACREVVVFLVRFEPAEGNVGTEEMFYYVCSLFGPVFLFCEQKKQPVYSLSFSYRSADRSLRNLREFVLLEYKCHKK